MGKSNDLQMSRNASNEVDLEQTKWNPNSKRFEAPICWTMWLTVTTNKMRIYIQEKNKTRKIKGPANFKKCLKWVDFVQTSWNTNSKLFEAAVCWTMCLTVMHRKFKRPANSRDCNKRGRLEANMMEPKFTTICSGRCLICGLQSLKRINEKGIYIRVKKKI